jgi:hypothetical protein
MTAFDPTEAAQAYADLETDELVRIAYLEPNYLPEAKAIAMRELSGRGVPENPSQLIEHVRLDCENRRHAEEMLTYHNMARMDRVKGQLHSVALIGATWIAALILPTTLTDWQTFSNDWKALALASVWVFFAIDAIRRKSRGAPRRFYLIVVIPLALFAVGLAFRMYR